MDLNLLISRYLWCYNFGFQHTHDDWLLFWGSDDHAYSANTISQILSDLSSFSGSYPDIITYSGCYFDPATKLVHRRSAFYYSDSSTLPFRTLLFFGFVPIHQATLFGCGARSRLSTYNLDYRLAADLFYFLQLSRFNSLRIYCRRNPIVSMSSGGVSGRSTFLRLFEVFKWYYSSFGLLFFIPFLCRYFHRLFAKLFFKSSA